MELLIFFLKILSILVPIVIVSNIVLSGVVKSKKTIIQLNFKTCVELSIWLTSIYSWYI